MAFQQKHFLALVPWLILAVVSYCLPVTAAGEVEYDSEQKRSTNYLKEKEWQNSNANAWLRRRTVEDGNNQTCPPCPACSAPPPSDSEPLVLQILVVDSPGIITMVRWNADDYYEFTNGRVKVEIKLVPTMPQLFEEIENDARNGGSLFDAYYTNPVVLGTAAMLNGFLDLTDFVRESPYADWTDVLLALRTYVTSFEEKIYIILLDGDTHTLFYRKDVLEHFGLQPPRTWDEYIEVAKATHGKTFQNQTLSGSCVSRIQGDHAMYWYHLVLSTITQTEGTATGSLFDSNDMKPLSGEAMAEMLRIHEEMSLYGTPDEYTDIINYVNNLNMNEGRCVLTFMWGDLFRRSKAEGSIIHEKLGIAPTPGSKVVLDRATGELVECDALRCPYAIFYDDIGFVNSAPYAANGGWGAAISANASPEKQKALADFFLWASSKEQSQQYVIANATLPWYEINGQDPYRRSQLDVDKWVAQGYDRELSKQYVEAINTNLISKNVVVEARFPKAGEIMSVLDKRVNEYLVAAVVDESIPENDRQRRRLQTAEQISNEWNQIIKTYDSRGDTVAPILEVYQRLRGVYVPNEDKNYLTSIRPLGLALMCIVWAISVACSIWVYKQRKSVVVQASQPPFLALICFGTMVMGSSIYTMGIDDEIASTRGCGMACMATPWLIATGFSVTFAALTSKILRLKVLMKNAANFRRIQVRTQDVLIPFCILMALNTAFLLTWTLADPLEWERVSSGRSETGELESYGNCTASGNVSVVMLSLIGGVNLCALIAANILSYQTRDLGVSFNESKYVGLAMASILQAVLIGCPLLFLADDNTIARYVVRSVLVFVICISVQLFIFIPKIMLGRNNSAADLRRSALSTGPGGKFRASNFSDISAFQDNSETFGLSTRTGPLTSSVRKDSVLEASRVETSQVESQVESYAEPLEKSGHTPTDNTSAGKSGDSAPDRQRVRPLAASLRSSQRRSLVEVDRDVTDFLIKTVEEEPEEMGESSSSAIDIGSDFLKLENGDRKEPNPSGIVAREEDEEHEIIFDTDTNEDDGGLLKTDVLLKTDDTTNEATKTTVDETIESNSSGSHPEEKKDSGSVDTVDDDQVPAKDQVLDC